jgi:hypothetical protein
VYGNVDKTKSLQISSIIENMLKQTNSMNLPHLSRQLLLKREYKLEEGKQELTENENTDYLMDFFIQVKGISLNRQMIFIRAVARVYICNAGFRRIIVTCF